MSLLCQYRPDDVVRYIRKKYYPVKTSLDICRRYKVSHAIAYLYKHTGSYVESIETYITLLNDLAVDFLDARVSDEDLKAKLSEYSRYFNKAAKVCIKYRTLAGKNEEQKLWLLLLVHAREVVKKTAEESQNAGVIVATLSDLVRRLLSRLMEHVEMDELLMPIADNCGEFDIANFKELFNTAIISYVLQERILSSAKELLGKQVLTGFNTLIRERHKAISISAKECAKCKEKVEIATGVEFVPFSCGHIYHPDCVRSFGECEICLLTGKSNLHFNCRDATFGQVQKQTGGKTKNRRSKRGRKEWECKEKGG